MEAGSGEELPSVTITVSAGGGEEDDQSLNDLVLQQDFGRCGWFGALVIVFFLVLLHLNVSIHFLKKLTLVSSTTSTSEFIWERRGERRRRRGGIEALVYLLPEKPSFVVCMG